MFSNIIRQSTHLMTNINIKKYKISKFKPSNEPIYLQWGCKITKEKNIKPNRYMTIQGIVDDYNRRWKKNITVDDYYKYFK